MIQEDKELLLKDLCARLPYGVLCKTDDGALPLKDVYINGAVGNEGQLKLGKFKYGGIYQSLDKVKPYLRTMSSMTEEESKEFALLQTDFYVDGFLYPIAAINMVNWLNEHHFDVRNLIEKGLAIDCTGLNIY